jgi:putative peptidoglycan lipid II flippase
MFIASWLPAGAISYLNYADRLAQLPLGVVGAAMSTALLPVLSRQLRAGKALSAHRSLNRGVELSLALTLPAAVALIVTAQPMLTVLFQRGEFTADKVAATTPALMAYALGLPAYVLIKSLAPGFFARGDTATPVKIGIATVAFNLCLNLALTPHLQHVGIALATALSSWANAGLLGIILARRGHWVADRQLRRNSWRLLGAALVMGAILWGLESLIFPAAGLWRFLGLGVLVAGGLLSYFGATFALGAFDLRDLLRRRRLPV